MTSPTIELREITKRYGSGPVLDRLDLRVDPGILALLGPNGAGKTTLVRILATLTRPDEGSARILGHDVVGEARAVRRLIGVTGQYAAVDEMLTGQENLVLVGRLLGLRADAARARSAELLDRFQLSDASRRWVSTYSGGMRRRLDLAMTLVRPPRLLILDEPTTGLDARSRQTLWEEIRRLAAAGSTVLLTTQYLEEADALADRIVVLDKGRVVADGSPDTLKRQVGGELVQVHGVDGRVERELPTDGTAADVARVAAGLPPDARVTVRRASLDDVFLQLTGGGVPTDTGAQSRREREEVPA